MASILLVDDDDQFRTMLNLVLKRAGHDVKEARNGDEALQFYRQNPSDLIITDIIMPEKEGIEMIIELHRSHPGARIIAMSGGGRGSARNYLEIAEMFGVRQTLAKPFSYQEVLDAIQSALDAR